MSSPPEPCCGSIMAVTGSPGATLMKVKATSVMPSNIGTSSRTRRKMYWLTALRLLAALHVRVGGALRIRSLGELVRVGGALRIRSLGELVRVGGALRIRSLGELFRVGGGCAPPPPVAAALASSLRAPSRGDPPHEGLRQMRAFKLWGTHGRRRWAGASPAGYARATVQPCDADMPLGDRSHSAIAYDPRPDGWLARLHLPKAHHAGGRRGKERAASLRAQQRLAAGGRSLPRPGQAHPANVCEALPRPGQAHPANLKI